MILPTYLNDEKERIINLSPQRIFLWNRRYDDFKDFPEIRDLYEQFPDKDIQRNDITSIFKKEPYKGFLAAMIWGGINASRPLTKGGTDTSLYRLMQHPKESVLKAIEYARSEILNGDLVNLFRSFSIGGEHKLPGIDSSYFTKLFYFLGEIEKANIKRHPLIWDKWTSMAHCALLIQLGEQGQSLPYLGINKNQQYLINLPVELAKAKLYQQYVDDFNKWAFELGVSAGKLEEFVFGKSLKENKKNGNPRIDLWKIIDKHFDRNNADLVSVKNTKPKKATRLKKSFSQPPAESLKEGTMYFLLQEFFKQSSLQKHKEVRLSVQEIEKILKCTLPNWAFTRKDNFWSNSGYRDHVQKRAWLSQGYHVGKCSINPTSRTGEVIFVCFCCTSS